jgi:G3E family GTPase
VETIQDQASNVYVGDTVERQLADANLVVLSKADLVLPDHLDSLEQWLAVKASDAVAIRSRFGQVPNEVVLQAFHGAVPTHASHDLGPAFDSDVLRFDMECDAEHVAQMLASSELELVRAKGFVPTAQGLRAVQIVGRRWNVSDAPSGAKAGVVVIAPKGLLNLARIQDAVAGAFVGVD